MSDASALVHAYAELLSLAAHELRTPASVVAGYLRMLQRDTTAPLDERQRNMVNESAKSCERLAHLLDELSAISRLDDGRAQLAAEPFDLFAVAEQAAAETHEAKDRGVRLVLRGAGQGAPLRGDRVRMQQSLMAILRAVLREQPDAGDVIVDRRVVTDGGHREALVIVAREPALADALTAPDASFDERRGGMGLALPLARRIIEHHGGRLWSPLASREESGIRSTIVMRLPIADK